MDIDAFTREDLNMVFRTLRTALRPQGLLQPSERAFLDTYARTYGLALAGADPLPLDPRAVRIEGAHERKRLVRLSAIAALLSAPVQWRSVTFVVELARPLQRHDPALDLLPKLT